MPDDFGIYDEEVEKRIKMSFNVNLRPKAKFHSPPAPGSTRSNRTQNKEIVYDEFDDEMELSREIAKAAKKAGIPMEEPKTTVIRHSTG